MSTYSFDFTGLEKVNLAGYTVRQINVGCWTGTLGTLMAEVKRRRVSWSGDEAQHDLWTTQYRALKALGKATVARWAEDQR